MILDDKKPNTYFGTDLEAMEKANNLFRWLVSEFRPYLGKKVCEVGAGQGNLTSYFLSESIKSLTSFEPSTNMFQRLEQQFSAINNFTPINHRISDQSNHWHNTFDSAVYVNVLEHIEDDQRELEIIHQCLTNNGHLLIYVPALSWLYSSFDQKVGHYRRYHKQGLTNIVKKARFDIIKVNYLDMFGIIPWYLMLVMLKKELSPNGVSYYDRFAIPVARKLESVFNVPVGKNLLLIARKQST